jgi:hypothetical protein
MNGSGTSSTIKPVEIHGFRQGMTSNNMFCKDLKEDEYLNSWKQIVANKQ